VFEAGSHPALHPGRSARVSLHGRHIGWLGELHPQWRQSYELPLAPVLFELDLDALQQRTVPQFQAVSRLQPVERDIAVIVDEAVSHAALMAAIHVAPTQGLLRSATLFDIYRPKEASASLRLGEKSLAVRLVLSSDEATLTEQHIEQAVQAVIERLQTELSARLRA
jgi:phenylalanyl-tRNA synthetase beta chain